MDSSEAIGALLAARHRRETETDPQRSLLDFPESPRVGDWTLRSALVRLAQPEPVRAGATLELIRRCDGALRHLRRALERHAVVTDRSLSSASIRRADGRGSGSMGGWTLDDPVVPVADVRVADLARLALDDPTGFPAVLDAYTATIELDEAEREAIGLVEAALELDRLADELAGWARSGPADPPVELVDATCDRVFARLEALGVAREPEGPLRRGHRG